MQPGRRSYPKAVIPNTHTSVYIGTSCWAGHARAHSWERQDGSSTYFSSLHRIYWHVEGSFHVKSNLVYLCSVFVLAYFSHQLDSNLKWPGRREPQLKGCLDLIHLHPYLWGIFLTNDWRGRAWPTVNHAPLDRGSVLNREAGHAGDSSQKCSSVVSFLSLREFQP